MSNIVDKPWGYYEDYYRSDDIVFKKLVIKPGQRTSLQKHFKRSETWFVTEGTGKAYTVSKNYERSYNTVTPGDVVKVCIGREHQIENNSDKDLVILEIQRGFCCEEDIVRIDDPYQDKR